MRKSLLVLLTLTGIGIAGCQTEQADQAEPGDEVASESAAINVEQTAEVNEWSDCPYIDPGWLENTNGERLTKQGIDTRFPTPACVFWSYQDHPQATVIVRDMPTVEDARAAVDWAAPIDATEPASFAGWEGGRGIINEQAVYAVQKDTHAVLVWSNQQQTFKSEQIAQEAIANLGL
ncbi:DUF2020 domain-containing protein [Corynebacterium sp. KPL2830]|uniref:DUF2020 domain-containing protein n=1 Tax=unclassified Corynebacterium TaxID=2624378 RepID=UPI001EF42074|nr:DUF2020 domain-containing protein [Corynebacterium sp. ACRPR]MCG7233604.1 DUF2020 domain-containing protein [Corynebacterium sp. ACRPR]MCG7243254.1 DUF2020 domain-containing protein [Corynebacterium sp. ACRPS]MCG7271282.1 DUF2020 domain-containing protein [Corynebacterium sp. ACRQM]